MISLQETTFDCPIELTLTLLRGKWKCIILWHLRKGNLRFNQLQKRIPGVTPKMLSQQLRDLEADKLIERTVYPEVPPKVEYHLTIFGKSFQPIIKAMYICGTRYAAHRKINIDTSKAEKAIRREMDEIHAENRSSTQRS